MDSKILEQAADWLDLEDEMTSAQQEAFARWYAVPTHAEAYRAVRSCTGRDDLAKALALAQMPDSQAPSRSSKARILQTSQTPTNRWPEIKISLAAAACLLLTLLLIHATSGRDVPNTGTHIAASPEDMSTRTLAAPVGAPASEVLADGSLVHLNADSALDFSQSANERHVSLTRGQVFFRVAPDRARPFTIDSGTASIRVVGTAFDVERLGDSVLVAVYEGIVQVRGDRMVEMRSGERVQIHAGVLGPVTQSVKDVSPDWRSGWLEVRGEPLGQVLARFQRYSERLLLLEGDIGNDVRVSGRFRLNAPEASLRLLAEAHGLTLSSSGEALRLRSR
ncbi:FecR family protein [Microbulbifer elongatus]|uniref:FecR family protein n=1 Tax=Microbulbifer elongatus TaxID=86173 RepID=UPI001E5D3071|nr:FecR domain-containing protein [Microbulbifer elongatus]